MSCTTDVKRASDIANAFRVATRIVRQRPPAKRLKRCPLVSLQNTGATRRHAPVRHHFANKLPGITGATFRLCRDSRTLGSLRFRLVRNRVSHCSQCWNVAWTWRSGIEFAPSIAGTHGSSRSARWPETHIPCLVGTRQGTVEFFGRDRQSSQVGSISIHDVEAPVRRSPGTTRAACRRSDSSRPESPTSRACPCSPAASWTQSRPDQQRTVQDQPRN